MLTVVSTPRLTNRAIAGARVQRNTPRMRRSTPGEEPISRVETERSCSDGVASADAMSTKACKSQLIAKRRATMTTMLLNGISLRGPNENKMSDGWRESASLQVEGGVS